MKFENHLNNLKNQYDSNGYLHLKSILDKKILNVILKKTLLFQKKKRIKNSRKIKKSIERITTSYSFRNVRG